MVEKSKDIKHTLHHGHEVEEVIVLVWPLPIACRLGEMTRDGALPQMDGCMPTERPALLNAGRDIDVKAELRLMPKVHPDVPTHCKKPTMLRLGSDSNSKALFRWITK